MKNFDEPEWAQTRSLLRAHLTTPPLEHPDFINSRVLEEIERSRRRQEKPYLPLRWLAWTGAAAILAACAISLLVLPHAMGPRTEEEFISQVLSSHTEDSSLSVTQFPASNTRGVVLWIEGAGHIPEEQTVQ